MVDGGADNDTVSYAGQDEGVTVQLRSDDGREPVHNVENFIGSDERDTVTVDDSTAESVMIEGRGERDSLTGGDGNDVIKGGDDDDDDLRRHGGNDKLDGDDGDDDNRRRCWG